MMIYLFNIHSVLTVLWSCPGPVRCSGQFSGHSSPPAEAPSEVGPGPSGLAQWCPCPWSWGNLRCRAVHTDFISVLLPLFPLNFAEYLAVEKVEGQD